MWTSSNSGKGSPSCFRGCITDSKTLEYVCKSCIGARLWNIKWCISKVFANEIVSCFNYYKTLLNELRDLCNSFFVCKKGKDNLTEYLYFHIKDIKGGIIVYKVFCRTYQRTFKLASKFMPYRNPQLIEGENKRKGIIVTILSGFTLGLSVLVFFRFINQI